jgi:hypothetical protein
MLDISHIYIKHCVAQRGSSSIHKLKVTPMNHSNVGQVASVLGVTPESVHQGERRGKAPLILDLGIRPK